MRRFKQYLSEINKDSVFSKPENKSEIDFVKWCETHASNYLKQLSSYPIYRGMSIPDKLSVIDTSSFNTVSANSNNIYTLWIDNDPAWSKYPKRSKSLICTTNRGKAAWYSAMIGETFLIIPSDNVSIGICPEDDIWDSFHTLDRDFSENLYDFVSSIEEILIKLFPQSNLKNYDSLAKTLKECTTELLTKSLDKLEELDDYDGAINFVKYCESHNLKNIFDLMMIMLTPAPNGFHRSKPGTFDINGSHEIWIEGICGAVAINSLSHDESNPLVMMLQKYGFVSNIKI